MTQDLDHLKQWIGKTELIEDEVTQFQIQGLNALFDDPTVPKKGDPVHPMAHWCFFMPRVPASEIGHDGHPKRGGFLPPVPLPRRMFGGSRTWYHQPLRVGQEISRKGEIKDVALKSGRSGQLVILKIGYEVHGPDGLALTEEHDVVYRDNPPADAPKDTGGKTNPPPEGATLSRVITPDPVMLFRYSAVTFNGHRIHYDRKYVTEVEGYPGLIVHGPLTATHVLNLGLEQMPGRTLKAFSFQARAPLFDIAPFTVAGKTEADGNTMTLWSQTPEGNLGTLCSAEFA